jgi:hypothetical protein
VGGAGAAHDDGNDANLGFWPVKAEGFGKRGVFISDYVRGVREVIVYAILPFPDLNLFN